MIFNSNKSPSSVKKTTFTITTGLISNNTFYLGDEALASNQTYTAERDTLISFYKYKSGNATQHFYVNGKNILPSNYTGNITWGTVVRCDMSIGLSSGENHVDYEDD